MFLLTGKAGWRIHPKDLIKLAEDIKQVFQVTDIEFSIKTIIMTSSFTGISGGCASLPFQNAGNWPNFYWLIYLLIDTKGTNLLNIIEIVM